MGSKRWVPDGSPVGKGESIGRRLFDFSGKELAGAHDQPSGQSGWVQLNRFRDTRGKGISVDRLGRTAVEPKVVNFLLPIIDAHRQSKKADKFEGWYVAQADVLQREDADGHAFVITPTPEDGDAPYHADIRHIDPGEDPQFAAFVLRERFIKSGYIKRVEPHSGSEEAKKPKGSGFFARLFGYMNTARWKRQGGSRK